MWTNNYNGEQYIPYVTIDLDTGIYVFNKNSATGKTRLYKALLDVKRYKDVILKEARFNGWTQGEIFIVTDKLIPNARRDDFEQNDAYYKRHNIKLKK